MYTMNRNWKKTLIISLLLLTLSFSCEAAMAKTKVTIATYANQRYQILKDVLVPKWQTAHPELEIEVVIFPDFWNKLLLLLGTGDAPDIVDTAGTYLFGHVIRGGAVNLTPYIEKEPSLRPDNFWPGPLNEARWPQPDGDGIYALPWGTVGGVLWYNIDLLNQAGVHPPNSYWTYDDLRAAAKKIARDTNGDGKNDIWGMAVDSTHTLFDPLVKAYGGYVLNPDRRSSGLDSPEAAKATQLLAELILQDGSAAMGQNFANGNVGFQIYNSSNISTITTRNPSLNWGVAMVPRGPVLRNAYGGSDMWEVMKRPNQEMDAVLTVLKELLSYDTLEAFWSVYDTAYNLPASRAHVNKLRPTQIQQVLMESVQYMSDADWSPDWAQWQTAKRNGINPILQGSISVQEGLRLAKQGIDNVLANAYGGM
ncbi:MAG TPA: sugar ABC transporter substrate-binding protein [Firmicutes bacterium]|nr:sugar ABC transporter substrate-binding protein [Bacillota bacterium]